MFVITFVALVGKPDFRVTKMLLFYEMENKIKTLLFTHLKVHEDSVFPISESTYLVNICILSKYLDRGRQIETRRLFP
jgi:hypothetical protein